MGALEAFKTTWSRARATFGEGTPTEGAAFDASKQLRASQTSVESAAPGDRWRGSAAEAYAEANRRQGNVLGRMADLDQRLGAEVDRSAAVVAAGRRNLDEVKQWVTDAASSVPAGANREQALLPIARKGIGEVADILKQSNNDLNAIGGRIRAIGNEYKALGPAGNVKKAGKFKEDGGNPGGVRLPKNPYPPDDPRHEKVEEVNNQLLKYGVNFAAYLDKYPPGVPLTQAEYEEAFAEWTRLNGDLTEIVKAYADLGIPVEITGPSPPPR
jgi:uncharacterized protein YukE